MRKSFGQNRRTTPQAWPAFAKTALRGLIALAACLIFLGRPAPVLAATDHAAVERLVAIEDIRELRARFGNAVDNRRWDELRSLFASDAVVDVPAGLTDKNASAPDARNKIVGVEAIMSFMHRVLGDKPGGSHAVILPLIEITSAAAATGVWRLGTGTYHDTYEKVDGRWHFKIIRFEPSEPGQSQPSQPH